MPETGSLQQNTRGEEHKIFPGATSWLRVCIGIITNKVCKRSPIEEPSISKGGNLGARPRYRLFVISNKTIQPRLQNSKVIHRWINGQSKPKTNSNLIKHDRKTREISISPSQQNQTKHKQLEVKGKSYTRTIL